MTAHYIYNANGFLTGVYEGDGTPENSTILPPVFVDGKTPQFLNGVWVDHTLPPTVTPATFRMLFTVIEEKAIKEIIAADPAGDIAIWWSRLFESAGLRDVELGLKSVQGALAALVELDVLTDERVAEILTGQPK